MADEPKLKKGEIFRKVYTIRPPTDSREPIRIFVSQSVNEDNEINMTSAVITGFKSPLLIEKPDLLRDLILDLARAWGDMVDRNKLVNNGKH